MEKMFASGFIAVFVAAGIASMLPEEFLLHGGGFLLAIPMAVIWLIVFTLMGG